MADLQISYAQCAEDILLQRVLGGVTQGFYIDVGAFDPVVESVTKIFYDAGWRGINLEPNPDVHEKLVTERTRDINLDVAASDAPGQLTLNLIPDTGLTTLVGEFAQNHAEEGFEVRTIEVETQTLSAIWDRHVPEGQDVHFLKIDVEGAEEAVIRGADWTRHRPWVVVAEAVLPRSTVQNHQDWEPLLLEAGYLFAWFDGLNRYYVAQEKAKLKDRFLPPPNLAVDGFIPHSLFFVQQAAKHRLGAWEDAERQRDLVQADHEALHAEHGALQGHARGLEHALAWHSDLLARRPKPLWEKLLFRSSGKPKKPVRRLLFHTSGKPRGIFRSWVLRPDGKPRMVFHRWMSKPHYQKLRKAVRIPGLQPPGPSAPPPPPEVPSLEILSEQAAAMKTRLDDLFRPTRKAAS